MSYFKNVFALIFLAISSYLNAQEDTVFHSCLYPESSFTVGGSFIHAFEFNGNGINSRIYYNVGERFCVGPEFSYLVAEDKKLLDYNIVAHYIFDIEGIGVYPVGGLNYTVEKETSITHGLETKNAFNAVFGGGIHRNFGRFTLFGEYSHHFGKIPEDLLNAGLLISFTTN